MSLPPALRKNIQQLLEERLGGPVTIQGLHSGGGGCINASFRVETREAGAFFLKWNHSCPPEMFPAEADGLRALQWSAMVPPATDHRAPATAPPRCGVFKEPAQAQSGTVPAEPEKGPRGVGDPVFRIPEVLGAGGAGNPEDPAWLLLEFVPSGPIPSSFGRRFGEALAKLHGRAPDPTFAPSAEGPNRPKKAPVAGGNSFPPLLFGWHRDNFIGSLPQANRPAVSWVEFWRDLRLEPQIRIARTRGLLRGGGAARILDDLLSRLEMVMRGADEGGPSLLHGDLWSGNFYAGPGGEPVLIDPAVYVGVGEVDLAMMELFGGVPRGFREGYESIRPVPPEYFAFRRDLYQLYYLLVHVNLFGTAYVGATLAAARRAMEGS